MCQVTKILASHIEKLTQIEESLITIMRHDDSLPPLVESALQSVTHARQSLEDLF